MNPLIRLFLLMVVSAVVVSCSRKPKEISIRWENTRATALKVPLELLGKGEVSRLHLRRAGLDADVLGEFEVKDEDVLFVPVVPLTRGMKYEMLLGDEVIGMAEIPVSETPAPTLVALYPTQDTLPENLLKVYLQFSEPMEEGHALDHITLLNEAKDTMKGTFLALQPELWNAEGTVLTLWLDPGRIKRDLIPNLERGAPLEKNHTYRLSVGNGWRSKEGRAMEGTFVKQFVTTFRDDQSPRPSEAVVTIPREGTRQSFELLFNESLDFSVLSESVNVVDESGHAVAGEIRVGDEERRVLFVPGKEWQAGTYEVQIETRLEDLSGNNINRPFDRDLKTSPSAGEALIYKRTFVIPD